MTHFCQFHEIASTDENRIESSSLGITGWAFANVRDWSAVDFEIGADDDCQSNCVAFRNHEPTDTIPDTMTVIR